MDTNASPQPSKDNKDETINQVDQYFRKLEESMEETPSPVHNDAATTKTNLWAAQHAKTPTAPSMMKSEQQQEESTRKLRARRQSATSTCSTEVNSHPEDMDPEGHSPQDIFEDNMSFKEEDEDNYDQTAIPDDFTSMEYANQNQWLESANNAYAQSQVSGSLFSATPMVPQPMGSTTGTQITTASSRYPPSYIHPPSMTSQGMNTPSMVSDNMNPPSTFS